MTFQCCIQGYHDRATDRIYLNLRKFLDANASAREARKAADIIEKQVGFLFVS